VGEVRVWRIYERIIQSVFGSTSRWYHPEKSRHRNFKSKIFFIPFINILKS